MDNSFCRSISRGSAVYKGTVIGARECVTGRLFFYSKAEKLDIDPHCSQIIVGDENELGAILNNDSYDRDIVGAVLMCDSPSISVISKAEALSLPILMLSHLPDRHNGKIVILDPESSCIFVDPDIDAIERYSRTFESDMRSISCFYEPISYTAFSHSDKTPVGALHVCSAGKDGEIRSEDELFDDYRDLCESVRPLPLTLMLCPAYPLNDESRERFLTHLKAIFRAAVYGEIRILCGGPCTLTVSGAKQCLDAILETKELLKKNEHELNTEIQAGLLVSSPLTLCSHDKPSFDFLCLDIEKLARLFLGISARSSLSNEAICEFIEFLEKALVNGKHTPQITSVILNEEIKKSIPEKTSVFNGIDEFFVKK